MVRNFWFSWQNNLQGDGSLLIVRQSAREGRSKRTKRCISPVFSFFERRLEESCYWRNMDGCFFWEQCITGQRSSRGRQLESFRAARLSLSWGRAGALLAPKTRPRVPSPIHRAPPAPQPTKKYQVLHQSNNRTTPLPPPSPTPKN